MITADEIVQRIQAAIPGAVVRVQDTGGGDHWSAVVVAQAFEGKTRVEQHKMVQAPLKDKIADNSIHALQLKTMTPKEAGL
ncbi:MAG: BolA family transcriptional regulator [Planctomycetes bacterium]|nr:BolA family transcriptional regulator [Planctomycetota bacterium]MCW8141621.1 BolA family transcriptional regulator [Planctomycetota bacterium]